jgi:hypothetical protein
MAKFTEIRHGMFLDEAFQEMNVLSWALLILNAEPRYCVIRSKVET